MNTEYNAIAHFITTALVQVRKLQGYDESDYPIIELCDTMIALEDPDSPDDEDCAADLPDYGDDYVMREDADEYALTSMLRLIYRTAAEMNGGQLKTIIAKIREGN